MGFFGLFKRKTKLKKIKRSEVVDNIVELESRQKALMDKVEQTDDVVNEYFQKGAKEKSEQMRALYASKIQTITREKEANIKRIQLLNYKVGLLNRLKEAIDDRDFFVDASKTDVGNALQDTKQLMKFLSGIQGMKESVENNMTETNQLFNDFDSAVVENDEIYGVTDSTEDILAKMEIQSKLNDEQAFNEGLPKEEEAKPRKESV